MTSRQAKRKLDVRHNLGESEENAQAERIVDLEIMQSMDEFASKSEAETTREDVPIETTAIELFSGMKSDISPSRLPVEKLWDKVRELVGEPDPIDDFVLPKMEEAFSSELRPTEMTNDDDDEFAVGDDKNAVTDSDLSDDAQETSGLIDMDYELTSVEHLSTSEPILRPLSTTQQAALKDDTDTIDAPMAGQDDVSFNDSSDDEDDDNDKHVTANSKGIDIRALAAILDSAKEATRDINSESDVVLVLGATGTGKSTFIQAIAGHKFKTGWDKSLNRDCYVVDGKGEAGFDIGEGMRSRTRHVRSFFRESSSTFYVDSSGFGDTEGIETDIATSICVKDIASRCRRIRFVVLINAYSFYLHRAKELRRHLHLVANFVGHNFNTYKTSFTFLFSHCNNAFDPSKLEGHHGAVDVLATMRDELILLLKSLKQDSSDPGLKDLVDFLRVSLKKGYPYCGVFDPVLSDMEQMLLGVEPATSSSNCIVEPAAHVKCSLTSSAKVFLSHELSQRQESILTRIEEDDFFEGFLADARAIFTLTYHIGGEVCQGPCKAIQKALVACSTELKNRIFSLTRAGLLDDGASSFTVDEAKLLKTAIENLSFVESLSAYARSLIDEDSNRNGDVDSEAVSLLDELLQLVEEQFVAIEVVMSEASRYASSETIASCPELPDLRSIATKLQKLWTLSQAFGEKARKIHKKAAACVHSGLVGIGQPLSQNGENVRCSPSALLTYVVLKRGHDLGLMELASASSSRDVTELRRFLGTAKALTSMFLARMKETLEYSVASFFRGRVDASSLREVLEEAITIQSIIEDNGISRDLQGARILHNAAEIATIEFTQRSCLCVRLIDTLDPERGHLLEQCFQSLQSFVDSVPSKMRKGGFSLHPLFHHLTSHLREHAGKLEMCAGAIEPCRLKLDAGSDKELLRTLHSCCWIDAVLREDLGEDSFVNQALVNARRKYAAFADNLSKDMKESLGILDDEGASLAATQGGTTFLIESLATLRTLSSVIDSNHAREFSVLLGTRIVRWCDETERRIVFSDSIQDVQFGQIEKALVVAKSLEPYDELGSQRISQWLRRVTGNLTAYRSSIESAMKAEDNFAIKGELLNAAAHWSDFPSVLMYLPTLEDLRQQLRSMIIAHAHSLQKKISDGQDIDIDEAEQEVSSFLEALKQVNTHVGEEATRWTEVVIRALEARKEENDERFRGFIDDNDFSRVVEYLSPLKQSGDSRMQARFQRLSKTLSTVLWYRIESFRAIVSTPSGSRAVEIKCIKDKIVSLRDAQSALETFISDLPPPSAVVNGRRWKLSDANRSILQLMEKVLKDCVAAIAHAIERLDFCGAVESGRHATLLAEIINDAYHQTPIVADINQKVTSMLSSVDAQVKDFLIAVTDPKPPSNNGWFSMSLRSPRTRLHSGFPPDTSKLRRSLDKLKGASVEPGCPERILNVYQSARHKLSRELNCLAQELQDEVREGRFSRPIRILTFLQEEMISRGMKEHCELEFEIDSMIIRINEEKSAKKQARRADFESANNLDQLAQRLDRLLGFTGLFYRADYEGERTAVVEQAREMIREIHLMIRELEFCGLRGRLVAIVRVHKKLQRHLKFRDNMADGIQQAFSTRASSLLQDMESSLQLCSMETFERLFASFHDLITDAPSNNTEEAATRSSGFGALLGRFDHICRRLQQKVSSTILTKTREKLEKFDRCILNHDYAEASREAEHLRNVGYFLISSYELYREEVSGNATDSCDQQLIVLRRERFGSDRVAEVGRAASILQLDSSATLRDMRQAFMRMCHRWHPDKNPDNPQRAHKKMTLINNAKTTLSDEQNLALYRNLDFRYLTASFLAIPRSLSSAIASAMDSGEFRRAADLCDKTADITFLRSVARGEETTSALDVDRIRDSLVSAIRKKANALRVDVQNAWTKQDFVELHHSFATLESLENAFKARSDIVPESLTSRILSELIANLEKLEADFIDLRGEDEKTANRSMKKFGLQLIHVGRVLDGFPRLKKKSKEIMLAVLNNCRDEPWGASFIFRLGLILENGKISDDEDDARIGRVIVNSFHHFEDVRTVIFNREVITAPVAESVKAMESHVFTKGMKMKDLELNRSGLENEYTKYQKFFTEFLSKYVHLGHEGLVKRVYEMISELGPFGVSSWDMHLKDKIPEIVAGIFATFTIIKSGDSFKRFQENEGGALLNDASDPMNLLFRPHNIQVLAVLRLLGVGDSRSSLSSHVMEVRTGEGKSMILGALSLVLALLGFSVRCVCYSEHLSERDKDLFKDIILAFGVEDRVVYSKIETMWEDNIAAKGDIREMTIDLLSRGCSTEVSASATSTRSSRAYRTNAESRGMHSELVEMVKQEHIARASGTVSSGCSPLALNGSEILLVDEVDVFFGPEFYGRTFNPVASLKDPAVEKLLRKIWQHRTKKPSFSEVKRWSEYQDLITKYSKCTLQVETEVKIMCFDVGCFCDPPYEVDVMNGRIGYSCMDSVDWCRVYGYRKAFAHLHEVEKGRLKGRAAERSASRNLCLRITCGEFSYARISPSRVLGVSGTLKALTVEEKRIVREFGVDTYSFVPSVYGQNNLSFDVAGAGIVIETEMSRYFQNIANEIHLAVSKGRSAIVFFENDKRLLEFKKSAFWSKFRHGNVLTSTSNRETRNYVIKKAATSGQVTISTAVFGRGTDFFCTDSKLEDAGGMLVIQSFLSIEKSEEVQIKGRTARQGKKGTYMLVLLESDLCSALGITVGECATQPRGTLYEWLDEKRQEAHKQQLSETRELVERAEERDLVSRAYLNALVCGEHRDAKLYLDKMYKGLWKPNES